MYLSWSAYYEGATDAQYFNILIPRVLDEIIRAAGKRPCDVAEYPALEFGIKNRSFDDVAAQICERKNEFHIIFVHADLGGRSLAAGVRQRREQLIQKAQEICGFDPQVAVMLSPKKELEAWALADPAAVKAALGVKEISPDLLPATPTEAEGLQDPKENLDAIIKNATGRSSDSHNILVRIAQEQNIDELRRAVSFRDFESSLRIALNYAGFLQ